MGTVSGSLAVKVYSEVQGEIITAKDGTITIGNMKKLVNTVGVAEGKTKISQVEAISDLAKDLIKVSTDKKIASENLGELATGVSNMVVAKYLNFSTIVDLKLAGKQMRGIDVGKFETFKSYLSAALVWLGFGVEAATKIEKAKTPDDTKKVLAEVAENNPGRAKDVAKLTTAGTSADVKKTTFEIKPEEAQKPTLPPKPTGPAPKPPEEIKEPLGSRPKMPGLVTLPSGVKEFTKKETPPAETPTAPTGASEKVSVHIPRPEIRPVGSPSVEEPEYGAGLAKAPTPPPVEDISGLAGAADIPGAVYNSKLAQALMPITAGIGYEQVKANPSKLDENMPENLKKLGDTGKAVFLTSLLADACDDKDEKGSGGLINNTLIPELQGILSKLSLEDKKYIAYFIGAEKENQDYKEVINDVTTNAAFTTKNASRRYAILNGLFAQGSKSGQEVLKEIFKA